MHNSMSTIPVSPTLSATEQTDIDRLRDKADKLVNGNRGNLEKIAEVLQELAWSVAAIRQAGIVTPLVLQAHCALVHETGKEPQEEPVPDKLNIRLYRLIGKAPWPVCAMIVGIVWIWAAYFGHTETAQAAAKLVIPAVTGVGP